MATCGNGCGKSCSGTIENYCGTSCGSGCHSSCSGNCTGDCSNTCSGGCKNTCKGTCTGSCTGCSGCGRGCAGACSSTETYNILAAQFNDIAYSRGLSNTVTQGADIKVTSYNAIVTTDITAGTNIIKKHASNMAGWTVTLP